MGTKPNGVDTYAGAEQGLPTYPDMPNIGKRTRVWEPHLSNISPDCIIGDDCTIHSHVWIGLGVKIGNRVKIQAFTFIPDGVTIEDDVFIGPRVTFTNDKQLTVGGRGFWEKTVVKSFAKIGASVTILPGLTIGSHSRVGAGSVVIKDVRAGTTVVGVPARVIKGLPAGMEE